MKFSVLSIFIFMCLGSYCQNLVINPSFEDTVSCPDLPFQVEKAIGWTAWRETPDFFHECSTTICDAGYYCVHVPDNIYGFQNAATGVAYMGMFCYGNQKADAREIIGGELIEPLVVGDTYHVSFKVSTNLDGYFGFHWACNKIGIRFSLEPYNWQTNPAPVDNIAHIYANEIITDTSGWTLVEGEFIADQNYAYFGVGNFFDNANTDTLHVNSPSSEGIFMFVDDICISKNEPCSIIQNISNYQQNISSIWTDGQILFIRNTEPIEVFIYNLEGQLVSHSLQRIGEKMIDVSTLCPSIYLVAIISENKSRVIYKLVKS